MSYILRRSARSAAPRAAQLTPHRRLFLIVLGVARRVPRHGERDRGVSCWARTGDRRRPDPVYLTLDVLVALGDPARQPRRGWPRGVPWFLPHAEHADLPRTAATGSREIATEEAGPRKGASGVADVLVERVGRAESALQRDELLRVALKRDEEQAGVELAARGVDAVRVGVAAAQDRNAAVRLRRRQPDMGIGGIAGLPSAASALKSSASCSCSPVSGAPLTLRRPIISSCSSSGVRSQASISIRIRRATSSCRPAASAARRRRRPRRASRTAASSSLLRLLVPSLKPEVAHRLLARGHRRGSCRSRAASSAASRHHAPAGSGCVRRGTPPADRRRRPGRRGRRRCGRARGPRPAAAAACAVPAAPDARP